MPDSRALSRQGDTTLLRREIVCVNELRVGDMRQVGRYISPVESIEPYYEFAEVPKWHGTHFDAGVREDEPSENYITLDNLDPPHRKDEQVVVWRPDRAPV